MKKIFPVIFVLVLFVACAANVFAQGSASRVTGTVEDSSGATLTGATVTLTNEATNVSFTTQTTDTGSYTFDSVQVGTYTVTVEQPNFKRFVSTGNAVNVNQPATINAALEAGGVNETVTVNASVELVQTGSSGNFGNTVEERPLEALPLVGTRGRNPLQFIEFQPGVVAGSNAGGGVHVHGARDRAFNFTLDGIDVNDGSAGGSNFTPIRTNPDAITQFQVVTGNFTAELGRSSGASVTQVTRSGTNDFHGNLFEFYQTPRFHANEYVNTINNAGRPQFVQHIFGGSIGGPVYLPRFGEGGRKVYNGKDRTFFFVNMQLLRTSQSFFVNRTVYTADARAGRFRYATGGGSIQNGNILAGRPSVDANGNVIVPIATFNVVGNANIPLSLDPTTQGLINLTPLPNNFRVGDGLNTAGFSFVAPQTERQYDFTTKIDHKFNDNNTVYVRYSQGAQNTLGDNGNGGLRSFPDFPNFVDTFRTPRNLAANYRATLTPVLTNEFIAGFNRFTFSFDNPDPNVNAPVILGLVRDPLNREPSVNNARTLTTYQFIDNLSYVRAAHTFKFGTNLRFQRHLDNRSSVAGSSTREIVFLGTGSNAIPTSFGTTATAIPSTGATAINAADRTRLNSFLSDVLGRVSTIQQGFVANEDGSAFAPGGSRFRYNASYPEFDFFAQDTWKLRPNFTLDYGLRYEVRLSPRAPDDIVLRPAQAVRVGETPTNAISFEEGKLYDDQYKQFAPSVGFAWDPFSTGKTSVRANYRLAYDRTNTFVFSSFIFQSAPGLTRAITLRGDDPQFGSSGALLRNGLPTLSASSITPQQFRTPPPFSTNTLTVVDPNLSYPRTHQYGVSFQREIGFNSVIEVNYIGRQGRKLFGGYDANQVDLLARDSRFNENFLQAFNRLRDPATRANVVNDQNFLINALLLGDTRLGTVTPPGGVARARTGAEFLLAQSTGNVPTGNGIVATNIVDAGSVSQAAALITQGIRTGNAAVPVFVANGFSPFTFQPYPQFAGAINVLDNNDRSRYNALEVQFSRRFNRGLGFQISYTLAKSEDTRSFDPTFAIANRGAAQSSSSTPFDINNREANYARSDFDRRHAVQGYFAYDIPFGNGRRFLSDTNGFVDRLIGGFELAGIIRAFSGRPFTVYSGINTTSNAVQSAASCNGCTPDMGRIFLDPTRNSFFTAEQRAQFFAPAPGEFSNTGRNFFTGAPQYQLDLTLGKRIRFDESRNLELRLEAQNATNTPSFGFPVAIISDQSFGQVNGNTVSGSRKVQLAAKFNF